MGDIHSSILDYIYSYDIKIVKINKICIDSKRIKLTLQSINKKKKIEIIESDDLSTRVYRLYH